MARLTFETPEDEKLTTTSIRIVNKKLRWLDEVAERETAEAAKRGEKRKLSRNDVIEYFLTWALEQYWEDRGGHPEVLPVKPESKTKK